MPTANITIIIGKSKRRRSFFSYAQHQGRRIRHYGLTVLICFSVAPDYAIREILPDGLCPSGAAGPLAPTIVLRGYPPHTVPLAPHAHWGCGAPRRRQASLGHGDACKGCLQGDASKGCGHWCVICLWSSARCVSGGHVLIARHAVLQHCNMRPQHSHHHSPRSLWLSLCHRPATV